MGLWLEMESITSTCIVARGRQVPSRLSVRAMIGENRWRRHYDIMQVLAMLRRPTWVGKDSYAALIAMIFRLNRIADLKGNRAANVTMLRLVGRVVGLCKLQELLVLYTTVTGFSFADQRQLKDEYNQSLHYARSLCIRSVDESFRFMARRSWATHSTGNNTEVITGPQAVCIVVYFLFVLFHCLIDHRTKGR